MFLIPLTALLSQAVAASPSALPAPVPWIRPPLTELGGARNTGLDTRPDSSGFSMGVEVAGLLVAIPVEEEDQGFADLNGDGDAFDVVMHVWDERTGQAANLGVQAYWRAFLSPQALFFSVRESELAQDLNGDLDTLDVVLSWYDNRTQAIVHFGQAGEYQAASPGGPVIATFNESGQGELDANGDGDARDSVLQVVGPAGVQQPGAQGGRLPALSLRPRPALTRSLNAVRLTPPGPVVFVDEVAHARRDRNGDGDARDTVAAFLDPRTGGLRNLGLACQSDVRGDAGRIVLRVREGPQGNQDLNGDGDAYDEVAFLFEVETGTIRNLGTSAVLSQVLGDWLALVVREANEGGQDLNGDGDALDDVLFVQHVDAPSPSNLGLATLGNIGGAGSRLLFTVGEAAQGQTDLNGDGDLLDFVLHTRDLATGLTTNLGSALQFPPARGERLVPLLVDESASSADFNFDGDVNDVVLGIYDAALDTFLNSQLAVGLAGLPFLVPDVETAGGFLAARVLEASSGADLNGDGDESDIVVVLYDADAGVLCGTGLAGDLRLGTRLLAVSVDEYQQGGTDLNGDGDISDQVVHVLRLP